MTFYTFSNGTLTLEKKGFILTVSVEQIENSCGFRMYSISELPQIKGNKKRLFHLQLINPHLDSKCGVAAPISTEFCENFNFDIVCDKNHFPVGMWTNF